MSSLETQRHAYLELLTCLEQIQEQPDSRPAKLLFLDAAREYLEADDKLDAHRAKGERSFYLRQRERAELLTCVWMVEGHRDLSDRVLDRLIGACASFLRKPMNVPAQPVGVGARPTTREEIAALFDGLSVHERKRGPS